jgi:hypothetical protein
MAYPAYEDNGGIGADTGATVDVPFPATVDENDVLFTVVGDADNDSFSVPAGWTRVDACTGTAAFACECFWKLASGSESGTETFTSASANGNTIAGIMFRFSGCIVGPTPFEGEVTVGVSVSDSPTISEVTSTGPESLFCCLMGVEDNRTFSGGTNYSVAAQELTATGDDMAFALYTYQKAAAGTVSAETGTIDQSESWGTYTLSLVNPDFIAAPTSAHSADNLTVTMSAGSITVSEALSTHSADNLVLSFSAGSITIAEATSSHAADNLTVTMSAGVITIAEATSSHSTENLTLVFHAVYVPVIPDVSHAHSADAPLVTFSGGFTPETGINRSSIVTPLLLEA